MRFGSETVKCGECGAEYDRAVMWIGERRAPQPPPLCTDCAVEDEGPSAATPEDKLLVGMEACGVNVRQHARCTFGTFDPSEAAKALAAAGEFLAEALAAGRYDPVRGLYLVGPTGAGKTHLAVATARQFLAARGPRTVIFDRAARLITELQDTYGSGKTGAFLEARERVPLWVLDDLGTEKATDDSQRMLYDLLNAREGHATLVTSNLAPAELGNRFRDSEGWARIASRLAGFRAVGVAGRDRRFR